MPGEATTASGASKAGADLEQPPLFEVRFTFSPWDLADIGASFAHEQMELLDPKISDDMYVLRMNHLRFYPGNRYGQFEPYYHLDGTRVPIPSVAQITWDPGRIEDYFDEDWKTFPSVITTDVWDEYLTPSRFWDVWPLRSKAEADMFLEEIQAALSDGDFHSLAAFNSYMLASTHGGGSLCAGDGDYYEDEDDMCSVLVRHLGEPKEQHEHDNVEHEVRMYGADAVTFTEEGLVRDEGKSKVLSRWLEYECLSANRDFGRLDAWLGGDPDFELKLLDGRCDALWQRLKRTSRTTWKVLPRLVPTWDREKLMRAESEFNPWV